MKKDIEQFSSSPERNNLLSAEEISFILNAGQTNINKQRQSESFLPQYNILKENLQLSLQSIFSQNIKLTLSFEKHFSNLPVFSVFRLQTHRFELICKSSQQELALFTNMCMGYRDCTTSVDISFDLKERLIALLKEKIRQSFENFFAEKDIKEKQELPSEISLTISNEKYSAAFYFSILPLISQKFPEEDIFSKDSETQPLEICYPPLGISPDKVLVWKKGTILHLPFTTSQKAQVFCHRFPVARAVIGKKDSNIAVKLIDKVN